MTKNGMSEADWENLALETLDELGWRPVAGEKIAPGTDERTSWDDLVIGHGCWTRCSGSTRRCPRST